MQEKGLRDKSECYKQWIKDEGAKGEYREKEWREGGHDGCPSSSAGPAASRSLASTSILLRPCSSTGLINTLDMIISRFVLQAIAKHAPVHTRFDVLFLV